jgi:hypothetical protein
VSQSAQNGSITFKINKIKWLFWGFWNSRGLPTLEPPSLVNWFLCSAVF